MPVLRSMLKISLILGLAALPTALIAPAAQAATTLSNPATITIPAGGAASPYPSTIFSTFPGLVSSATVTLTGLTHSFASDLDILLVAPGGQSVVLMSDVGGNQGGSTFTFADGFPTMPTGGSQASGTYGPTNLGTVDTWPAPAPAGPYGSQMSALVGSPASGTWSLYVFDDLAIDGGSISGGWSITLRNSHLSVSDASLTEGDSGASAMTFTVSMSVPNDLPVSVDFVTGGGTASSGSDYAPRSGTRTFQPGQVTKTITVPILGDTSDEPNETFVFHLLDPDGGAAISDANGIGTIIDNDDPEPPSSLAIGDWTDVETHSGTVGAVFLVNLSPPSSQTVTVDFTTIDGTAKAPTDYTAKSGTRTFAPGETQKTITVFVNGDTTEEADETFSVILSDVSNANLVDDEGLGTITDDDRPVININNAQVTEADGTTNRTMTFAVTLNHASPSSVTVHYATANGSAIAPGDYTAKSGTLTFTAGQVSKNVTVTVRADNLSEGTETFSVLLDTPTNASIGDGTGTGTILDDD